MWAVSLVLRNLLYFFHYFSLLCSLCSFHIVSPRASIPKSVLKFFFCFTSLFFVYSERFPWLFHNSLLNYLSQLKFKFSPATLCDPMDCSTSGLPVHHQLLEFAQTHVHWVGDNHPTISSSLIPFSSHLQSFPAKGSFHMSQFFTSGGQSIGVSPSASVLPMNTQDWSPLGWTSLQSRGLSRVFSNTAVQRHQFFSAQLALWSKSALTLYFWEFHLIHGHLLLFYICIYIMQFLILGHQVGFKFFSPYRVTLPICLFWFFLKVLVVSSGVWSSLFVCVYFWMKDQNYR